MARVLTGTTRKFAKQSLAIRRRRQIVRSGRRDGPIGLGIRLRIRVACGRFSAKWLRLEPSEPNYGGIYCSEVKDMASLFNRQAVGRCNL